MLEKAVLEHQTRLAMEALASAADQDWLAHYHAISRTLEEDSALIRYPYPNR